MYDLRTRLIALVRSEEDAGPAIREMVATGCKELLPILRELARKRPEHAETVREAIGTLKKAVSPPEPAPVSATKPRPDNRWIPLGGGRLGIGHRPGFRAIPAMADEGVTDVVTLLSQREGAKEVGSAVRAAGMRWTWIDLPNGDLPPGKRDSELAGNLQELAGRLAAGATVYVHCSAGLHRTGMIAAALLRRVGLDAASTLEALFRMRPVTAEQVGTERLGWAGRFAGPRKE